ncbi:hypothetical protein Tco_0207058 [Tanacetum coccineum]
MVTHSLNLPQLQQVPKVIAQNEPASPHTKVVEGPPDLVNTERTNEQKVQDEQIITQPSDSTSGNNTKVLVPTIKPLVPEIHQLANQPNETNMNDLESNNETVDTPFVSPFLDSDNDSDDGEVLNELYEYGNVGMLCQKRLINSFDVDDLAFEFKDRSMGFVKKSYLSHKFVVLEDIREFIVSGMAEVVMGRPFRVVTHLEYDCIKGLVPFTKIFDTYIFRMPRTIPRLKNFNWSTFKNIGDDVHLKCRGNKS